MQPNTTKPTTVDHLIALGEEAKQREANADEYLAGYTESI